MDNGFAFRILGPVELWCRGEQCDLPRGRASGVLGILLLSPGTTVPADALIDRLWDASLPAKARENLSAYVARLRASLRDANGDPDQLTRRAGGYVLDIDPEAVDLHEFRRMREQAQALTRTGHLDDAARLLRRADALWTGPPLAGLAGEWFGRIRRSLQEERRAAIVDRVRIELEQGKHAALVGELAALLAEYPLDETFAAYRMTALSHCGRTGEALALYRETRDRLVQEQGAQPGTALAELHQRILRGDSRIARRHGHVAAVRDLPDEANLEPVAAFEIAYGALEPSRQRFIRTLSLNPGSCMAVEVAAVLTGSDPDQAAGALAALADAGLLTQADDGRYRFHDHVKGLIKVRAVQDEPESDRRRAIGRVLDYYLGAADKADRILFPFRRRLPVSISRAEQAFPPMAGHDDATAWLEAEWRNALLVARYAAGRQWQRHCAHLTHRLVSFLETSGHWDDAISASTVALQACHALDDPGLIAQASLQLSAILQQAGRDEMAVSLAEEATVIYRSLADQRGLAEALDLIGLARQRGGQSLEALAYFQEAEELYAEAADPCGIATTLSHSAVACWHARRYPDAMSLARRALTMYRDIGDRRGEGKTLSNIGTMQLRGGHDDDALDSFQSALEIFTQIGGTQSTAILHHNIGNVHRHRGSYQEGLSACRRAQGIYREIGDLANEAEVLVDIAAISHGAGGPDEALAHYRKASSTAEQAGNRAILVIALQGMAGLHQEAGRYGEALETYQTALTLARQLGDTYEEAKILNGIAETTLRHGDRHAARIMFRQALAIFQRLGVPEAESTRIQLETAR